MASVRLPDLERGLSWSRNEPTSDGLQAYLLRPLKPVILGRNLGQIWAMGPLRWPPKVPGLRHQSPSELRLKTLCRLPLRRLYERILMFHPSCQLPLEVLQAIASRES